MGVVTIKLKLRINDQIKENKVRVIDTDGKQIGVLDINEALDLAKEKKLDLVEISQGKDHSVCKIVDYSKYRYEKEKAEKENKKKQKVIVVKEIKIKPRIGAHDLEIKKKKIVEFLEDDKKVKVMLVLKGRENLYADKGIAILEKLAAELDPISVAEKNYSLQKQILFSPKANKIKGSIQ